VGVGSYPSGLGKNDARSADRAGSAWIVCDARNLRPRRYEFLGSREFARRLPLRSRVLFLLMLVYGLENRLQEAFVSLEGFFIVTGNRCFYRARGGGCHEFKSADKDAHHLFGRGIDSER
jgi:hypothetical protein